MQIFFVNRLGVINLWINHPNCLSTTWEQFLYSKRNCFKCLMISFFFCIIWFLCFNILIHYSLIYWFKIYRLNHLLFLDLVNLVTVLLFFDSDYHLLCDPFEFHFQSYDLHIQLEKINFTIWSFTVEILFLLSFF